MGLAHPGLNQHRSRNQLKPTAHHGKRYGSSSSTGFEATGLGRSVRRGQRGPGITPRLVVFALGTAAVCKG